MKKIKNIYMSLLLLSVSTALFAARMTVYNNSRFDQYVEVYNNQGKRVGEQVILANQQKTFNAGIHSFKLIKWKVGSSDRSNARDYFTNIPSPRTMLSGAIILKDENGNFTINFNDKGILKNPAQLSGMSSKK